MKQVICILLLAFYTTFNIGLVVNTHYCSGKVSSVSLFIPKTSNSCGLCGKTKMPKDCCQDKQTQISIDDEQMSSHTNFDFSHFSDIFLITLPSYSTIDASGFAIINKQNHQFYAFETGPPKTAIYIQFHSLII